MLDPKRIPSPESVQAALDAEIFDQDGKKLHLRDVVHGQRVVLVFIRHFWCINCQAYTQHLSESIPPNNLPPGTSVVVIGCGSYQPIKAYLAASHSLYPIYANPSLSLYHAFEFQSSLAGSKKGEEKEYEAELGGMFSRTIKALKEGPARNIAHAPLVGPKSLNGGEVVMEADGTVSYIHRMQHSADHTEIGELARRIGSGFKPRRGSKMEAIECC